MVVFHGENWRAFFILNTDLGVMLSGEEEEGGLIMAAAVGTSIKEGTGVCSAILDRPQTKVRTGDMISL